MAHIWKDYRSHRKHIFRDVLNPFKGKVCSEQQSRKWRSVWGQIGETLHSGKCNPSQQLAWIRQIWKRLNALWQELQVLTESLQSVRESAHRQNDEQCGEQHCKIIQRTFFVLWNLQRTKRKQTKGRVMRKRQKDHKLSLRHLSEVGEGGLPIKPNFLPKI